MQNSNSDIGILIQNRKSIFKQVEGLQETQLLHIPDKFKTNILWNIGHLTATQQILNYHLCGLKTIMPDELITPFRKGSSPASWSAKPDIQALFSYFNELPDTLAADYQKSMFSNFKTYTTSAGILLNNIGDAIAFNNFHEGIHTGVIQSILKFI